MGNKRSDNKYQRGEKNEKNYWFDISYFVNGYCRLFKDSKGF